VAAPKKGLDQSSLPDLEYLSQTSQLCDHWHWFGRVRKPAIHARGLDIEKIIVIICTGPLSRESFFVR